MTTLARLLAAALLLAALPAASAQAPREIPYQGTLADGGAPVTAATGVVFRLHDAATGGAILWAENQTVTPDADGRFTARLGSATDLPANFDQPLWLSVTADGTALGPRTPLGAAPVALALYGVRVTPPTDPDFGPSVAAGLATNVASGSGAVVAGGGFDTGSLVWHNTASGDLSVVSGGYRNTATFEAATVSGGAGNTALSFFATVGGGNGNTASAAWSTVGGGTGNTASGAEATVGGGAGNTASGTQTTVGGGAGNTASGSRATVPGGQNSQARGDYSLAAGHYARAVHDGAFVWSDNSQSFSDSLLTTGPNQFLVRAAGGVGLGTNAPTAQLHVETLDISLPSAALLSEAFVVESGDAVAGLYSDVGGSWGSAIALGEIAAGALTNKWSIARRTGATGALHFTFGTDASYAANNTVMRIDTDGSVHADASFTGGGADLAEFFPLADGATVVPGQVVGLTAGCVSLATDGAEQVAVISSNPAFVGNPDAADGGALVALVGQVAVDVSGDAGPGDLLVASGAADGRARAVSPTAYQPADGAVLGRVLTASADGVVALVGVDEAAALRGVVARQAEQIEALRADRDRQTGDLRDELDALKNEVQAIRDALAPRASPR